MATQDDLSIQTIDHRRPRAAVMGALGNAQPVSRVARRVGRLVWWTVSLQIVGKVREYWYWRYHAAGVVARSPDLAGASDAARAAAAGGQQSGAGAARARWHDRGGTPVPILDGTAARAVAGALLRGVAGENAPGATRLSRSGTEIGHPALGVTRIATIPECGVWDDPTGMVAGLMETVRGADTVIFADVPAHRLDAMFRLRLGQIVRREPAANALSIVLLRVDDGMMRVAPGFAARARASWPFARAVFATFGEDVPAGFADRLGVPVHRIDADALRTGALPEPLRLCALASQRVAFQVQPWFGRCGSSTAFENQIESLVASDAFTVRVFIDENARQGETLRREIVQTIVENNENTRAHLDVVAIPPGARTGARPPAAGEFDVFARAIQGRMACRILDPLIARIAERADAVIVNHVLNVPFALRVFPKARMLLDVHDEFSHAAEQRLLASATGAAAQGSAPSARLSATEAADVAAIARLEAALWRIPEACTNVNLAERDRVAEVNTNAVIVLPRPYVPGVPDPPPPPEWDALIVADQHFFNVQSVTWFLDAIWRRVPAVAALRIAVAGRVDRHLPIGEYQAPNLRFLGFVEDLDALRARSRVTLVPDRHGTGIAIKTLTALAAGHPVVSTDIGLRGLGGEITRILPGHRDATAFAADLVDLLGDPTRLAERRSAVRDAYAAIRGGAGFGSVLAAIAPLSDAHVVTRLGAWRAAWAELPREASREAPAPQDLAAGVSLHLGTQGRADAYLTSGWHAAEPWGRWMDGCEAGLSVPIKRPAAGAVRVAVDIQPGLTGGTMTLLANGETLEEREAVDGELVWVVPEAGTRERVAIVLTLIASHEFCPADQGDPADRRVLGLGVRAVTFSAA